jgi:hypothetical protein
MSTHACNGKVQDDLKLIKAQLKIKDEQIIELQKKIKNQQTTIEEKNIEIDMLKKNN